MMEKDGFPPSGCPLGRQPNQSHGADIVSTLTNITVARNSTVFVRKINAMDATGTLFGWAFGDAEREDDQGYLDGLRSEALANARQAAEARGFGVVPGSEVFTVLSPGETLVDIDTAPDDLVVRCTVKLTGEGADRIHAEGPMNG